MGIRLGSSKPAEHRQWAVIFRQGAVNLRLPQVKSRSKNMVTANIRQCVSELNGVISARLGKVENIHSDWAEAGNHDLPERPGELLGLSDRRYPIVIEQSAPRCARSRNVPCRAAWRCYIQ